MKNLGKWSIAALCGILSMFLLTACGQQSPSGTEKGSSSQKEITLKVGASPVPHGEILNSVKDQLSKEGIKLQVVEFTDYVQPNMALNDGELDANFFQHQPYLDQFNKDRGTKLVSIGTVHLEPMGLYSSKISSLSGLPDGAQIAIPNDPTNGGRALLVLQSAGLLKLKDGVSITATPQDIVSNPKNIKISELEAAQLPRSLDDVDAAVINVNYVLQAGIDPHKALFTEDSHSPYANIVAVRSGDENRPELKKLMDALHSPEVKSFIQEKYKGAIVPAF